MRRNPDWYGGDTKHSPPKFMVDEYAPMMLGRHTILVRCLDTGRYAQRVLGSLAKLLARSSRLSGYQFVVMERDGLHLAMVSTGFKSEVERKDWVEAQRTCKIFVAGVQEGLGWRLH